MPPSDARADAGGALRGLPRCPAHRRMASSASKTALASRRHQGFLLSPRETSSQSTDVFSACSEQVMRLQKDPEPGPLSEVPPVLCFPGPPRLPQRQASLPLSGGPPPPVSQKHHAPHAGSLPPGRGVGCAAHSARMCLSLAATGPRLRLESQGEASARRRPQGTRSE